MNSSINLIAAFGDEIKSVKLSQVAHTAGTTYHLYVDGYFWAWVQLIRNTDQWKVMIQTDRVEELLTSTDRDILIDLVKNHYDTFGWQY